MAVPAEFALKDWTPRSQLRAQATEVHQPATPCIDIHNHLGRWLTSDGSWMFADAAQVIALMDESQVEAIVNLDGMVGDELDANLERYDKAYPGRFFTFCQLDWSLLVAHDGVSRLLRSLEEAALAGARGVKVWKNLGLTFRDAQGELIRPDDDRVVQVLHRAGQLGLPVLIHTADPLAFFDPLDAHNERVDELRGAPDWWFGDRSRFPSFDDLWEAHARLVMACPQTIFIGAHMGCLAEDLDRVSGLLHRAPNYHVDIAGRMAELGRQPRRFARLVAEHPDRVLFGTDIFPATAEQYRLHYRFLETEDESFEYAPGEAIPPQGRWAVSAAGIAPHLLPGLYRQNAARLLAL